MNKRLKIVLSLAVASGIAAGTAYAVVRDSTYRFYFSDATRVEVVGEEFYTCGGMRVLDGVRTSYYREVTDECGEYKGYCHYYPNDAACEHSFPSP